MILRVPIDARSKVSSNRPTGWVASVGRLELGGCEGYRVCGVAISVSCLAVLSAPTSRMMRDFQQIVGVRAIYAGSSQ